jgi:DNA-binding NarL/FixJ family response regulator
LPLLRLAPDRKGEIALIDRLELGRECTLGLLRAHLRTSLRAFASVADLLQRADASDTPCCVILCPGARSLTEEPWQGDMLRLRSALPATPVIILSDHTQLEEVVAAFRKGARGYILTSSEPRLAVEAIQMVLAGNTYFPAEVLIALRPGMTMGAERPARAGEAVADGRPGSLAPKQLEVLRALVGGRTNKDIARELAMEESTVKVHVRQIMRRLGVTNRTQAALVAQRLGIAVPRIAGSDALPSRPLAAQPEA